MIANSGGASANNEVVVNPNLIMNCDLQKGIVSTKDTYLSLESGASKTGSGEFTKFWKYEYKTGTYDSCSASINWGTYIGLSLYNYSTNFNGESVEVTLPDGSTSWKYVYTLGDHYFEGAYISATGTVQNYYSCRGKVVTLSALLQGRVKVQLLGTDDALIGELPEVSWEDRYNQVLKSAQFTVPADCTKLSVKVICEPSYRIYETDDIGNTNYDDDTNPGMNIYGLKLELGDTQTLCDADGNLLPQPQDSYEVSATRNVAYCFADEMPSYYAWAGSFIHAAGIVAQGDYNPDTGTYDQLTCGNGLAICASSYRWYQDSLSPSGLWPTGNRSIVLNSGIASGIDSIVIGGGAASGQHAIVIGGDTSYDTSGTLAIGIGYAASARGDHSVAIQGTVTETGDFDGSYGSAIAIGGTVSGKAGMVFGQGEVSGLASVVLGKADVSGALSLAVGTRAASPTVTGDGSIAIGYGWNDNATVSAASAIAIGQNVTASAEGQMVLGNYNVNSTSKTDKFIIGDGTYQARKNILRVTTASGVYATSTYHSSGADYAEMFEWLDGNPDEEDRAGRFVVLNGDKLQLAQPDDDDILGIVSGNASVIGDVFDDAWQGQWLTDIFGRPIMEEVEETRTYTTKTGEQIPHTTTVIRQKLNPDWDSSKEYIPRSKRPEWDAVGLVGKLIACDDGTCEVNGYATVGTDGIATRSVNRTPYRVMKRLDETHIQVFIK